MVGQMVVSAVEKNRAGWEGICWFKQGVQRLLTERVAFEQRPEEGRE